VDRTRLTGSMIKEPVLSKIPKCTAEGCWYGVIENDDETVGSCPVCFGTGVVADLRKCASNG
jgi:hypothetical protein